MKLHIDLETRSACDLTKAGQYAYAADPTTLVILWSWAIDNGPVTTWFCIWGDPMPPALREALLDPAVELCAHNASFERVVLSINGSKFLPADVVAALRPLNRWNCTAARAAHYGLPRDLEGVGRALRLRTQKDIEGYKLMMRMCRPRGLDAAGKWEWVEDEFSVRRLGAYCEVDVKVEHLVDLRIPDLPVREMAIWRATERMNDRGIRIDDKLLGMMTFLVADAEKEVHASIKEKTHGAIPKVSNHMAVRRWLVARGYPDVDDTITMEDGTEIKGSSIKRKEAKELVANGAKLKKGTGVGKSIVKEMLDNPDLPELVKEVLLLRQEGGKSSAAKYKALMSRMNNDGRVRGAFVYCGAASTHRWSSRGAQLQNMPRGGAIKDIDGLVDAVLNGASIDHVRQKYGSPLVAASEMIRPTFIAKHGHWFARGDYSQIEARVNNGFGGQVATLQAFRDYDTILGYDGDGEPIRKGPDLYKVTAARIVSLLQRPTTPDEVTKAERQTFGKVPELACIASGELVLTDHGLVPIEDVTTAMRVWDGIEWVNHDGVVFRGVKECMTYDGLTATPDHEVFVEGAAETVPFATAAERGLHLDRAGLVGPRGGNGSGDVGHDHSYPLRRPGQGDNTGGVGPMLELRGAAVLASLGSDKSRNQFGVPILCGERDAGISLVAEAPGRRAAAVYGPGEQGVPALWRERDNLRLPDRSGSGGMGYGESAGSRGAYAELGTGPGEQRPWLRAGEPAASLAGNERQQPGLHAKTADARTGNTPGSCDARVSVLAPRGDVRGQHAVEHPPGTGGERCGVSVAARGQVQTCRPVWDILNAGPRNRFTVSGRLVHNCGFQGGVGAFQAFARIYGVKITDEEAQKIVSSYRAANPGIVQFWKDLDKAAIQCMRGAIGEKHVVRPGLWFVRGPYALSMRLPAGSSLFYWYPSLKKVETPWGPRDSVHFWAEDAQKKIWAEFQGYGGLWGENATQSTARDVNGDAIIRLDDVGLAPVLTVHDENGCEISRDRASTAEEAAFLVEEQMAVTVPYLPGVPIAVEASAGLRYIKG